ncbi:MAG: Ig-like domain-containing protein [Acidobacteria bacterium]|nr:Ig-like domain-containing protein [Acidobacteriota bacterium]
MQNGTVVTFTSSFGVIEPTEARTEGGKATVRFVASTQSGTARIGAFSGAARAEVLEVLVGGAAASNIVLRADPQTVPASGGTADIIATVVDEAGNPLQGVIVSFSANAGQLSAGQATTNANGEARVTLTAPRTTTVTARAGSQTATIEVTAATPGITITGPTTAIEAGISANFTLAPVTGSTGNSVRSVLINWGDGTTTQLGAILGSTIVPHTYARAGSYTIHAATTDTQGIPGELTLPVNVTEPAGIGVTLTATPNPVSVSNALQQGLVEFTASAGALGGGTTASIQGYWWDFGDGGGTFTTGGATNHRYTAPGNYNATVTVRSTAGHEGVAQRSIRVNP